MREIKEHDYATYPRRFATYKWFKPILTGLLFAVLSLFGMYAVDIITRLVFKQVVYSSGYDTMDFYSAAGAFNNGAMAALSVPCLLLAVLIVKERPISSYFSSMGGWRWKVMLKTLAAGFIIFGIPRFIWYLANGKTGEARFTVGGFILLAIFLPFQGLGEELVFRGYITQTVSSWFKMTIVGVIVQALIFTLFHDYNIIGVIAIAVSAFIYSLVSLFSRGLEAPSVLHFYNNAVEIFMAGFGYGIITAEQNIPDTIFNLILKILFCLFIIYAERKLKWFDEVQNDDVAAFSAKKQ